MHGLWNHRPQNKGPNESNPTAKTHEIWAIFLFSKIRLPICSYLQVPPRRFTAGKKRARATPAEHVTSKLVCSVSESSKFRAKYSGTCQYKGSQCWSHNLPLSSSDRSLSCFRIDPSAFKLPVPLHKSLLWVCFLRGLWAAQEVSDDCEDCGGWVCSLEVQVFECGLHFEFREISDTFWVRGGKVVEVSEVSHHVWNFGDSRCSRGVSCEARPYPGAFPKVKN